MARESKIDFFSLHKQKMIFFILFAFLKCFIKFFFELKDAKFSTAKLTKTRFLSKNLNFSTTIYVVAVLLHFPVHRNFTKKD